MLLGIFSSSNKPDLHFIRTPSNAMSLNHVIARSTATCRLPPLTVQGVREVLFHQFAVVTGQTHAGPWQDGDGRA